MEISSFPFPNPEDFYFPTGTFNFANDFDSSNTMKKRRIENDYSNEDGSNNTFFFNENEDNSLSFQDILSNLFPFENFPNQQSIPDNLSNFQADPYNQTFQIFSESTSNPSPSPSPSQNQNQKRAWAASDDSLLMQNETGSPSGISSGGGSHSQRRLWVKNRSKAWWEQVDSADCPEEEFKKAFRMSKATFDMICKELEPVVNKKDTMLRLAIPVRQRVAVCVWRLATGEPLREVSKRFGLGISTCHKLVLEVCRAIQEVLKQKYLHWPNEEERFVTKRGFEMMSGMPNVCGSLYTTHVPIIAPKEKAAAYYNKRHTERNQKTSYSISVQGVVNPKMIFTDVSIGWPGSMSDDKVLEKSSLFQRANAGLMKDTTLVGNSGHPLMDWVLAPYNYQNLTWTQHAFNEKVAEVQKVAKEAFMRLKARWSCLQKRTEMKLQDLPVVLMACCVLHNICEVRNEELRPELSFQLFDDEMLPENGVRSLDALHYRDQIAHKLLHHNFSGTTSL